MHFYSHKQEMNADGMEGMSYFFDIRDKNDRHFGTVRFDVFPEIALVHPAFTKVNKSRMLTARDDIQHICRYFLRDVYDFDSVVVYTKNKAMANILSDKKIRKLGEVHGIPVYDYEIK